MSSRRRDERGQAGIEVIPLGILVFVGGMLLVVNVWAVLDARMTVDAAARDYLRGYTNAQTSAEGRSAGEQLARATVEARGRRDAVAIAGPTEAFGPCRPATVTVTLTVAAFRIPFLGSLGSTEVSSTESELVAPYGVAQGPSMAGTACDG